MSPVSKWVPDFPPNGLFTTSPAPSSIWLNWRSSCGLVGCVMFLVLKTTSRIITSMVCFVNVVYGLGCLGGGDF